MTETSKHTELVAQRDNTKLAMWLFLGGEVVLFSSLMLGLIFARVNHGSEYGEFREHLSIPLVGLNTFILIMSSFLVVRGLDAIQHGNQRGLRNNLLGIILLGALFLAGQGYEWAELFRHDITAEHTFGGPFFAVTGVHGTHVFIGLVIASFVLIYALNGAYSSRNYQGVEVFGLYWHFVDVVWIVLFTLIYLY